MIRLYIQIVYEVQYLLCFLFFVFIHLGEYLTRTSASPLIKYMVDEYGYANCIRYSIYAQSESVFQLDFTGVELDKLQLVADMCIKIIDKLCMDEVIFEPEVKSDVLKSSEAQNKSEDQKHKQNEKRFLEVELHPTDNKLDHVKSKVPTCDNLIESSILLIEPPPRTHDAELRICEIPKSSLYDINETEQESGEIGKVETLSNNVNSKRHNLQRSESILKNKIQFQINTMRSIISNELKIHLNETEENMDSLLFNTCICDLLYCSNEKTLSKGMDSISNYERLKREDRTFWINLFKKYFSPNCRFVACIGFPDSNLAEVYDTEETNRIKYRNESADIDLEMCRKKLEDAIEFNSICIPPKELEVFPLPDPSNISMHPCKVAINFPFNHSNECEPNIISLVDFKIPIILCDVPTNFCDLGLCFNIKQISSQDKRYLLLLCELLTECPLIRDGKEIEYLDVVTELDQDTVENGVYIGFGEGCPFRVGQTVDIMWIKIKLPLQDYVKGLQWIYELAYQTKFTKKRLTAILKRLYLSIPDLNRNGARVNAELVRSLLYDKNVIQNLANTSRQKEFFQNLFRRIKINADEVIAEMNKARHTIFNFENAYFKVFTNLNQFQRVKIDIVHEFNKIFKEQLTQLPTNYEISKPIIQPIKNYPYNCPNTPGLILGIKGIESSYFSMVYSVQVKHEDYCAVELLFSCLTMLEGPMWCEIRGNGLSYSYALNYLFLSGRIGLRLYSSAQPLRAFHTAKKILIDYISGRRQFTQEELDAGRNVKVFEYVADTKTVMSIANNALSTQLLPEYIDTTKLLQDVKNITLGDIKRVMQDYLKPMFDPGNSVKSVLIANPSKVDKLIVEFKKEGIEFLKIESLEKYYLEYDLDDLKINEDIDQKSIK